jgi:hypothetical protein
VRGCLQFFLLFGAGMLGWVIVGGFLYALFWCQ